MEPCENFPIAEEVGAVRPAAGRDRPLRILVTGVSWPMETFLERLFTGLAAQGHDLTLLRLSPKTWRPPADWLRSNGIEWLDAPTATVRAVVAESFRNPAGAWPFVSGQVGGRLVRNQDAASLIATGRWDVIYAPWINALAYRPELLSASTPVVTSCRGAQVSIAPWDPSRPDQRAALARGFDVSVLVHCVSDAIVQDALEMGLDPTKARVIRPAVHPADYQIRPRHPSVAGHLRVVGVGTLNWRKDYQTAIVAVRHAVDQGADVQLDLVGSGPDRQHLAFTIEDLDLSHRVRLIGYRTAAEVADMLAGADVFLHTSSSEGISNAVLEAMAAGLPVITTDAGGMIEAVRHNVDGLVTKIRDVAGIAQALVELADDPLRREKMGSAARERILEDFQLADQINAFTELFHEAAGR